MLRQRPNLALRGVLIWQLRQIHTTVTHPFVQKLCHSLFQPCHFLSPFLSGEVELFHQNLFLFSSHPFQFTVPAKSKFHKRRLGHTLKDILQLRGVFQKKNGIFWEFPPPPHPPLLGISKKIYRFFWSSWKFLGDFWAILRCVKGVFRAMVRTRKVFNTGGVKSKGVKQSKATGNRIRGRISTCLIV